MALRALSRGSSRGSSRASTTSPERLSDGGRWCRGGRGLPHFPFFLVDQVFHIVPTRIYTDRQCGMAREGVRWIDEHRCCAPQLRAATFGLRPSQVGLSRSVQLRVRPMNDSTTLWTVVASAGALLSAAFAAVYVWLTFRLVRSQTDPHVVVYVKHDESRPTILIIVIENVGGGLATGISFETSRPVPTAAWGVGVEEASPAETMVRGPLIDGIPTLGPRDCRKITWGQFGGLKRALNDVPIDVTCKFHRGKRQMPETTSHLEVNSFSDTDATGSEGARLVAALDGIQTAIVGLGGKWRRDGSAR